MIQKMIFSFALAILIANGCMAQETPIATSIDHATTFILVGHVQRKLLYHEAWIKEVATEGNLSKFRLKQIQSRANHYLPTNGYDRFLYTMGLYQFDCIHKRYRVVEIVDYDANGQVLTRQKTTESKWMDIVPETISAALANNICRY